MKTFFIGVFLVIVSWIISWTRIPVIYEHPFFPLWLGYILTINGLSQILFGQSLLSRLRNRFVLLFLISIPMWWYFEFFNSFLQNWHYVMPRPVSALEFNIRASIDFSTVIPAVLSTAFLFKKVLEKINKLESKSHILQKPYLWISFAIGIITIPLMTIYPKELFPLVWISPFLILDPINYYLGFPSVLKELFEGKWINTISVAFGILFTGFWWEMWNFYSLPKWVYEIPYVGFYKIFEMPILGYGGYLFFGLEVLSFTYLTLGILNIVVKRSNSTNSINFKL